MFNKNGESGPPWLASILEEKLPSFPIEYNLNCCRYFVDAQRLGIDYFHSKGEKQERKKG